MIDLRMDPDRSFRGAMVLAAFSGVLAALGHAPVSLPWATLIGLVMAFMLFCRAGRRRVAMWMGWAFGVGYFAIALSWIVEPFFVDPWRHGWMAPFALALTASGFAMFWAVAWWLAHWLSFRDWVAALAWPCGLALAELVRSYLLSGFPWALLGHVWIGWAPMQFAAWIGPHGLTLLTLFSAVLAVFGLRWRLLALLIAVFPLAGLYAIGIWLSNQPIPETEAIRPVLRLVQPNAPQHLKWSRDHAPIFFRRMLNQTSASSDGRPDLIIWPETSIPIPLERAASVLELVSDAAAGVPVVLGINRNDDESAYNSLVSLDASGAVVDIYDKYRLVPFGEFVPLGEVMVRFGITAFSAHHGFGYSPGSGARLLDFGGLGKALPLICYEAIFPQDVAAAPERPAWLLQITNDAWFGQISGPYQHLAQARLRAVEQGLPFVRVANTGVSAVIDARGVVEAGIPLGTEGFLDAGLPPPLPPTLYSRTGDWGASGALLLLLCGLCVFRFARRSDDPMRTT